MNDETFSLGFFLGILTTLLVILAIVLCFANRVNSVDEITAPSTIYSITIDDFTFTCGQNPVIKKDKVTLYGCSELFGNVTIIKGYKTLDLEVINN